MNSVQLEQRIRKLESELRVIGDRTRRVTGMPTIKGFADKQLILNDHLDVLRLKKQALGVQTKLDGTKPVQYNSSTGVISIDEGWFDSRYAPLSHVGDSSHITDTERTNWNEAYSWGDHSLAGYLTSESDPTVPAHVKAITSTQITNWNAAFGWGDHAGLYQPLDATLTALAAMSDPTTAGQFVSWNGSSYVPRKLQNSDLPAIAITDTFTVSSEAEMLALVCERGDVAVRSDLNKSFILKGDDPSLLSDWQELLTPTDNVLSVDGRTGVVTLDDLYAPLSHVGDSSHITGTERTNWDAAYTHSQSPHAPANANYYVHPSSHPISMITGLQTALDSKSDSSHLHDDRYSLSTHNHDSDYQPIITGLTSGRVPYWNGSAFVDSPIRTDGTDVSFGVAPTAGASLRLGSSDYASLAFQHSSLSRFWIHEGSDGLFYIGGTGAGRPSGGPIAIRNGGEVGIGTDPVSDVPLSVKTSGNPLMHLYDYTGSNRLTFYRPPGAFSIYSVYDGGLAPLRLGSNIVSTSLNIDPANSSAGLFTDPESGVALKVGGTTKIENTTITKDVNGYSQILVDNIKAVVRDNVNGDVLRIGGGEYGHRLELWARNEQNQYESRLLSGFGGASAGIRGTLLTEAYLKATGGLTVGETAGPHLISRIVHYSGTFEPYNTFTSFNLGSNRGAGTHVLSARVWDNYYGRWHYLGPNVWIEISQTDDLFLKTRKETSPTELNFVNSNWDVWLIENFY